MANPEVDIAAKVMTALMADRRRAVDLILVEKQAARLGIAFDAETAIICGTSAEKAQEAVLDEAVEQRSYNHG